MTKMSKFNSESPNNSGGGSKFNRLPVLNSSSCAASFSSDEIYTATVHFCNETKTESSDTVLLKRGLYEGIGLVSEESRVIEWQGNDNLRNEGGYPGRCLKEGLGSVLPRQINRGTMDIVGERSTHKCVRIEGSKIGPSDICKDPPNEQSSFSDRQYVKIVKMGKQLVKMSGTQNREIETLAKEICSIQKDHDYCGIFSRKVEYRSRLDFKAFSGLKRVATIPKVIPLNLPKSSDPIGRSFCIKSMSSTIPLYSLEGRPIESGDRCISAELEGQRFDLCLSFLFIDRKSSEESKSRSCNDDISYTKLANPAMVQSNFGTLHSHPLSFCRYSRIY